MRVVLLEMGAHQEKKVLQGKGVLLGKRAPWGREILLGRRVLVGIGVPWGRGASSEEGGLVDILAL